MALLKPKRPWYSAGLAFECTACGKCCAGPEEGYVWVNREEIATLAGQLGLAEAEFERRYTRKVRGRISLIEAPNADCIFLAPAEDGQRRCRVYALRPAQCRTWPWWRQNLETPMDWALAGTRCPGVNRGPLHDLDHITRELAKNHH